MTKDEYEDFALRYKGCGACFPMYHTLSRFEKMWFSAIQKDVAELEKENAELKGIKDIATLIRANNDTVITLMQLNNMLVSKNQQLTKSKKIIKKFSEFVNNVVEFDPTHPQEYTDLWIELCEKAEQLLNEARSMEGSK